MKKIIIVVVTVFLSAGCAAGGPADLTPALRVQDGGLQYQDESGNWKAVANQDAVKDALEQSAGKEADPSEAGKAPEIEESLSSPAAITRETKVIKGIAALLDLQEKMEVTGQLLLSDLMGNSL